MYSLVVKTSSKYTTHRGSSSNRLLLGWMCTVCGREEGEEQREGGVVRQEGGVVRQEEGVVRQEGGEGGERWRGDSLVGV